MDIIVQLLHKIASGIGPFFLLLGLLIFVHELGHYLVAVYFGVRVETFSLGFGKKIFSRKRGDTTYCISLIPLGGYVKMYGDDPSADIPEDQKKYSFLHKPVWPRIAIVLAGPVMNLLFAILVFAVVGMLGEEVPGSKIGDISTKSPAYAAGFRSGDTVIAVNGETVNEWRPIKEKIESSADQAISFTVKREEDGAQTTFSAVPTLKKNDFLFSSQRQVGKIEGLSLDSVATMIGIANPNSAAAKAGIKTLDIIEAVDGKEVQLWRELEPALAATKARGASEWVLTVSTYSTEKPDGAKREVRVPIPTARAESLLEQIGLERSDLFLMTIKPDSPAARAGLTRGDKVTQISGKTLTTWQDVLDKVKSFKPEDKTLDLTVVHDGTEKKISVTPELIELPTDQGAMEKRYAVGVVPAIMVGPSSMFILQFSNPLKALSYGLAQSWEWTKLIAISFQRLIQNEVSARNIGGVITIGRVASKSFEVGVVAFLKMMAIISINLFLLNLLPVPVLDGGHLLFFSIEALKGAPISFKKMEIAQQVGLVLLLSLMIFALFNDITHLISSW